MIHKITATGIKWEGSSNIESVTVDYPLSNLPKYGDIEEHVKKYLNADLNINMGSKYNGFSFIKWVLDLNESYMLVKGEEVFLFETQQDFIKYIRHNKEECLKKIDDGVAFTFWKKQQIDTFIMAYMFFRDCMDDAPLLLKFDFDNSKMIHFIKGVEYNKMSFYVQDSFYTFKDLDNQFPHVEKGGFSKDLLNETNLSFLNKGLKLYKKLKKKNLYKQKLELINTLSSRGIKDIEELPLKVIIERNVIEKIFRVFKGIKNGKEVVIKLSVKDQSIVAHYKENEEQVIYKGFFLIKKENCSVDKKDRLYQEVVSTSIEYTLNASVFNSLNLFKTNFQEASDIQISNVTDSELLFKLDEVDPLVFKDRVNEFKKIFKCMLNENNKEAYDALDTFMEMLTQVIEDNKDSITILSEQKE